MHSSGFTKRVLVLAMLAVPALCSQHEALSHSDAAFLKDASEGGMDEVSWENKKFGRRMFADHTKMNNELQALD